MRTLIILALAAFAAFSQTTINGSRTILGDWNASGATKTLPVRVGNLAGLPATCTQGEFYFATDGIQGRKLWSCTATNTWVRIAYEQGTANPATCTVGELFVNTSGTPSLKLCTATNTWGSVGGGGGAAVIVGSIDATIPANSTRYTYPPNYNIAASQDGYTPIPLTGTISKFYIYTSTSQPAGGTLVCDLGINGVFGNPTITVSASAASGVYGDTTNSVSVTAGDRLNVRCKNNDATNVSASVRHYSMVLQ